MRRTMVLLLSAAMLLTLPVGEAQENEAPQVQGREMGLVGQGGEAQNLEVDLIEDQGALIRLTATVRDDVEVRLVSFEFIHDEYEHQFTVDFSARNKTVIDTAGGETSRWVHHMPMSPQLITGGYEVIVRAFDGKGKVGFDPPTQDQDPMFLSVTGVEQDLRRYEWQDLDELKERCAGEPDVQACYEEEQPDCPAIEDPENNRRGLFYASRAGEVVTGVGGDAFDLQVTHTDPVYLKGGERLRAVLDPCLRLPWKTTFEVQYGGGSFTPEEPLGPSGSVSPENLIEGSQEVILRYYSRDLLMVLEKGTNSGQGGDDRYDRIPPSLVITLANVVVDHSAPRIEAPWINGTAFAGLPFEMQINVTDASGSAIEVVFPGKSVGTKVQAGDDDLGRALVGLSTASVRYDDRTTVFDPADRPFDSGDILYLDIDGSRSVTTGDLVLSGDSAGTVVDEAWSGIGRTLIDPQVPFADTYRDVDGDRQYGEKDTVYLDDPGGSGEGREELSYLDLRLSGARMGQLVLPRETGGDLRDGQLGLFAFYDRDGDGAFDHDEPIYYTGGSQVDVGDVRVANPRASDIVNGTHVDDDAFRFRFNHTLHKTGPIEFEVHVRDPLGNQEASKHLVQVRSPFTELLLQDLRVLNTTVLPKQAVHFEADINQTQGPGLVPFHIVFTAAGIEQTLEDTVEADNGTTVAYVNPSYPTGRHVMNVTVVVHPDVEVLNTSVLQREVMFEVFVGKVITPNGTYWIRANERGLAGSAVLDPGPDEEVFDLEDRPQGQREVFFFEAEGRELYWDPAQLNEERHAVTEFEAEEAEPAGDNDSPAPAVALLLLVLALVVARRRRHG